MKKILVIILISIFTASMVSIAFAGDGGDDGYTLSLKGLVKQSQENIKKVDIEIENQKIARKNEEREALARAYFEKGNTLYKQGKLKEAREQWQKALDLTSHPEMKDYIRQSDRKAKQQMKSQKVKTSKPTAEVIKGYDLTPGGQNSKDIKEAKPNTEKSSTQKKTDINKKPVVKKEKSTKKPKVAAKPKTDIPKIERGCVFQGSSLVVNDVKETQDKPKSLPKKKVTKPKKSKTINKKATPVVKKREPVTEKKEGYIFQGSSLIVNDVKETQNKPKDVSKPKKTETKSNDGVAKKRWWHCEKKDKPEKQKTEDKTVKQGYTFEGSSLVVNEVKEDKKVKSKDIKTKKVYPKVKTNPPAQKISKPVLQKEEKKAPEKGYDIFVK